MRIIYIRLRIGEWPKKTALNIATTAVMIGMVYISNLKECPVGAAHYSLFRNCANFITSILNCGKNSRNGIAAHGESSVPITVLSSWKNGLNLKNSVLPMDSPLPAGRFLILWKRKRRYCHFSKISGQGFEILFSVSGTWFW